MSERLLKALLASARVFLRRFRHETVVRRDVRVVGIPVLKRAEKGRQRRRDDEYHQKGKSALDILARLPLRQQDLQQNAERDHSDYPYHPSIKHFTPPD